MHVGASLMAEVGIDASCRRTLRLGLSLGPRQSVLRDCSERDLGVVDAIETLVEEQSLRAGLAGGLLALR